MVLGVATQRGGESGYFIMIIVLAFILAMAAGSLSDETLLTIVEDTKRGKLLLHIQHRIKGIRTIELDIATLALSSRRIPSRGSPVYAVDFSDGNSKWELRSNFEGIGDDTYNEIVNELKTRYASAWPLPKKWRRVI